jgi:predicted nucleic acid-binding protein
MEVLAGARDERHLRDLRGLLARARILPTRPADYEDAAALYRACRRRGETVRKLMDCLIAVHAIRENIPLLHADADFDVLARHTGLLLDTEGLRTTHP